MQHQKVGGKPLLIFANKQDQDGAVDETELSNRLELDTLMGDNRPYSNVVRIHVCLCVYVQCSLSCTRPLNHYCFITGKVYCS